MTLYERPEWHRWAACRGTMTDGHCDWFPESAGNVAAHRALLICATCPVAAHCAEAGSGEDYGIWGNTSPTRRKTSRAQRIVACRNCGDEFQVSVQRVFCSSYCSATYQPPSLPQPGRPASVSAFGAHSSYQRRPGTLKIRPDTAPADRHDRIRWAAADALDDDTTTRRISGGAA